jgi:hypothetical protein
MKGDDLDMYIATFQHLAVKAGFARDAAATVDKFAKRLNPKLLSDIFDKETSSSCSIKTMEDTISITPITK